MDSKKKKMRDNKSRIIEWAKTIVIAVILALIIRTFVIQAFRIPTESMEMTLLGDAYYNDYPSLSQNRFLRFIQRHTYLVGDHLFACKFIYGLPIPFTDKHILSFHNPKRFDVIVFKYPEDPRKDFIKRVIGLPGEEIMIREGQVYINREPLNDRFSHFTNGPILRKMDNYGPEIIPLDSYFVMGDNRNNSKDSRYWGFLPRGLIKGKALFIYWPPQRIRLIR